MSSPESAYLPSSTPNKKRGSSQGSADEDKKKSGATKTSIRKMYSCKTCQKSFTTSGHLSRHQRTHTGERAFGCPWPGCSTRCSRQDNLQQHYRTHLSPRSRKADLSSAKAMRAGIKSVTDVPKELLSKGGRAKGSAIDRKMTAPAAYKEQDGVLDEKTKATSLIPFKPGYLPNPQLPIPSTSANSLPALANRRSSIGTRIHPLHLNSRTSPSFSLPDAYSTLSSAQHLVPPSPELMSPASSPMDQSRSTQMHNYSPMDTRSQLSSYSVKLNPKVDMQSQPPPAVPVVPPMYRAAEVTASSADEYGHGSSAGSQDRFLNQSTSLPSLSLDLDNAGTNAAAPAFTAPPSRMFTLPTNIAQSTMFRPLAHNLEYTEYPPPLATHIGQQNDSDEFYQMPPSEEPSLDFQQWNTQYY